MLAKHRDAFICDLAETYHVFDYRSLSPQLVATLAVGLRDDSRTKLEMSGQKASLNTILLSVIADRLGLLIWSKTKDAEHGRNRPKSIAEQFLTVEKPDSDIVVFASAEEFEEKMKRIKARG